MALSPRTTSRSTIKAAESCSSPNPFQNTLKGYFYGHGSDTWVPATVYGTFAPMDPYIYCQTDPSYTGEAATAVFVVMYLSDPATGQQAQVQLGLRKYRNGGQAQISSGVYLEISYYPIPPTRNRQNYFISDIAPMPTSNTVLTVSRDCNTGVISALVGGVNKTPSVGSGSSQIDPSLWNYVIAKKGFAVGVYVELHDIRSHGPGTSASPYYVTDVRFTKCGGGLDRVCNGTSVGDTSPPPELNFGRSGLLNGDFKTWDTRN